jgi:hypothetical protein
VLFKDAPTDGTEVFRPDGTAVYDGAVYIMPNEDVTNNRYDRCRAVTVTAGTGFIKAWSHDQNINSDWGG